MKYNYLLSKSLVFGIIIIFIFSSFGSSIGGFSMDTVQIDIDVVDDNELPNDVLITCSTFGLPGKQSHESSIPQDEAKLLYEKIKALQIEVARDPLSDTVHEIQNDIITIAKEHNLLPKGVSTDEVLSSLSPIKNANKPGLPIPRAPGKASEMLCNYVSTGTGSALPIIIFPRLVPILLTPIPRLFVRWSTYEGITSCGGLRSGKGFIASGAQRGIALGFWGIGFSIFIPPVKAYGLFGYALYASVNAENISFWPPNYPPEVTMLNPPNGAQNVPISTSELNFHISDINKALMNYTVTTTPDVGSGSGSNKPDGTYSVPISGLEGTEEYTWYIHVDDGVHEVDVSSLFTTEAVAPVVSNPKPEEGKRYVSLDLPQLSFHLSDPQGDLMDYTVETSPDIGSGSGTNVGEGTYSVNINGLDYSQEYTWFVNVTDGTNWKHKAFTFQTEPIMVFDPFKGGWNYRKKITIDHTQVTGDQINFPVLVSTVDSDLRDKAQDDGDDILFMNDTGVANRLYHEIETYDSSTGELIAWVNITNLASTQDTMFYMYYGNSDCCSQQAPERVWDSYYKAIWHLNDVSGLITDSTFNCNDGTNLGATYSSIGKIGTALDFECDDPDQIRFPHSSSLDLKSEVTIELWFKPESFTYKRGTLCTKYKGYYTNILTTGQVSVYTYWNDGGSREKSTYMDANTPMTIDKWHHIAWSESSQGYRKIFMDSILDAQGSYEASIWTESSKLYMGHNYDSNKRRLDGVLDEVRISDIVRTPDWISTEYNNQNNPSSFLSFGSEETGP